MPGIVATTADKGTGTPLNTVAVLVARDGSYVDSAVVEERGVAWERPGTYEVHIRAPGYRDWIKPGVRVRTDGCHVQTVSISASLEPAR